MFWSKTSDCVLLKYTKFETWNGMAKIQHTFTSYSCRIHIIVIVKSSLFGVKQGLLASWKSIQIIDDLHIHQIQTKTPNTDVLFLGGPCLEAHLQTISHPLMLKLKWRSRHVVKKTSHKTEQRHSNGVPSLLWRFSHLPGWDWEWCFHKARNGETNLWS